MLEQVNPLPRPQHRSALGNGDRERHIRQRTPYVRRHVVRPLGGVAVERRVFRYQPFEESVQVMNHIGIGVFLDGQRRRSVAAIDRQEPAFDTALRAEPNGVSRELVKSLPLRLEFKLGLCCLLYTSPSPRDRTRSRMPSSA